MASNLHKRRLSAEQAKKAAEKLDLQKGEKNDAHFMHGAKLTMESKGKDSAKAAILEQRRNTRQQVHGDLNQQAGVISGYNTMNLKRDASLSGVNDDIQETKVEDTQHESIARSENTHNHISQPKPEPTPEKTSLKWIAEAEKISQHSHTAKPEPKPGQDSAKRKREENEQRFSTPFETNPLTTRPKPE